MRASPAARSSGWTWDGYVEPMKASRGHPNISAARQLAKVMVPSGATRMMAAWDVSKMTRSRSPRSRSSASVRRSSVTSRARALTCSTPSHV